MNDNQQAKPIQSFYPVLIISLCAAFLFYKYVLQIYPSVITNQLMQEFNLAGAGLGNLAAAFYYAYMITQLFVGVLLDKYSTRWLTSTAILGCALGVFLFARAHSGLEACLSRGLMGVGVAFATIAYMKLAATWFPPRQYALISGLLGTAAMAGAVFGQAPLAWLVTTLGWRTSLTAVGIAGFILTVLFIFFVRDTPSFLNREKVITPRASISFTDILNVFKNKQNWLLTLYGGLAFCPVVVFGGLWGNPFLEQAYALSKTQAASLVSLVFLGFAFGSPILGFVSDRLDERRFMMFFCTLLASVLITLILYCHPMPIWVLSVLLFLFGFLLGAYMLVFTIGKELNSLALTATVIAMINMSDAILDGITEPGIGKLLDLAWDGKIVDGVHYFSLHSYHIALGILPIYLLIGALSLLWVKETSYRKT